MHVRHSVRSSLLRRHLYRRQCRMANHDFEPLLGSWKFHLKRRLHPLAGSNVSGSNMTAPASATRFGTAARARYGQSRRFGQAHRRTNAAHVRSHESPVEFVLGQLSRDGKVVPPQIGEFKDGRGEFYAQDTFNGKSIFVRFVWTNLNMDSAALRAILLGRWRQDLGSELDHRPDEGPRRSHRVNIPLFLASIIVLVGPVSGLAIAGWPVRLRF